MAPDHVLDEALRLAQAIAANGPLGVQLTKRSMRRAVTVERATATLEERQRVLGSEDAREGARAFVEKRPPVWSGT